MINIRKLVTVSEEILTDGGRPAKRPVRKVAAVAVIENPFAGKFVDDLTPLIDGKTYSLRGTAEELAERISARIAALDGASTPSC